MGLSNRSGGFVLTGNITKRKNKKSTDEYLSKRLASTAITRPTSKSNLAAVSATKNSASFRLVTLVFVLNLKFDSQAELFKFNLKFIRTDR